MTISGIGDLLDALVLAFRSLAFCFCCFARWLRVSFLRPEVCVSGAGAADFEVSSVGEVEGVVTSTGDA